MAIVHDPVVIVSAMRTPMGRFQGALSALSAPQLGAAAIRASIERAGIAADAVDELFFGCVLPAGLGQAPARQAALGAGLNNSTRCTTLNKMCGSGMQAVILAHDSLQAGSANVVMAGGMESMSNAPYLLVRARQGYRMGHDRVLDHLFLDGLEDAYEPGRLMGTFAEDCAAEYGIDRATQDNFAFASLSRARQASDKGLFRDEIVPVQVSQRDRQQWVSEDELPVKVSRDKIASLKAVFREGGTVTAANSSSISDGAAALLLMRHSEAQQRGLTPVAVIHAHSAFADQPSLFPTAPVGAIQKLLQKTGWYLDDIDLFEINEAFAVVSLFAMNTLVIPHDKVNAHGGACALGHPIGASGARILVTLISALRQKELKRGIAAICIGGGEATALALECLY